MKHKLFTFITGLLSKELSVVVIAALPVFELRLSIPVAILYFHMSWLQAFVLSLFGNLLVILPLLLFFKYFFHRLQYLPVIGRFFKWWFARVERRSGMVRQWGFWGLALFVSIPLPGTGAWTGAAAATLIEMPTPKAALAISAGVAIAGAIITTLSLTIPEVFSALIRFAQ